jgi:hypothetical protein
MPQPPASLQERLAQAHPGDYVVTAQEGNYSLLSVRSLKEEKLVLEEIAVPQAQIELKKVDWKQWVANRAPGHTSWTLYEIQLSSGTLIDCFSLSKNGWVQLDASEQFLNRLLTLRLAPVPRAERKKIGPLPSANEPDTRALWNPSLIMGGKKKPKAEFVVMTTTWPDDGSQLALCKVDLYFAQECPDFPFPFWIEVQSPHYTFKSRAIDSGQGLSSPLSGPMPHRAIPREKPKL